MAKTEIVPVFRVLRLIRDSRSTKGSQRELLYALGLRCRPAQKFVAWPSYRQLALDTGLDEVTLQRAAKKLEDAKLIKRVVRANRSNCFFINVKLLQEQAAEVSAAEAAAKKEVGEDESPFGEPLFAEETNAGGDQEASDDDWNRGGGK